MVKVRAGGEGARRHLGAGLSVTSMSLARANNSAIAKRAQVTLAPSGRVTPRPDEVVLSLRGNGIPHVEIGIIGPTPPQADHGGIRL